MLQLVKSFIPVPVQRQIRKIRYYRLNKGKKQLFGDLAPLVPRVEDMFDGPRSLEEFKRGGEEFLKLTKEICDLQPDEKMLDIGCGLGRKTLPLTQYFNASAVYEGIDIMKEGIDWCGKSITPRYPNFHFQQIDVYNKFYNPRGKYQAREYKFPYEEESFTFVTLGSVFTHMLPRDVENYLTEIQRVLKKGGRCLISYFLLNDESLRLIEKGESTLNMTYASDGYRTATPDVPEAAIGLDEGWVRNLYGKLGLAIRRVDYGSWCGRQNQSGYQDLIYAVKE